MLPAASTFLNNSFLFSGGSAIVSPHTGNSNLPNSTAGSFSSVGSATVDISGVAGILSINAPTDAFSGTIAWGSGSGMLRLNASNSGATDLNRGSATTHFALGTGSGKLVNRNGGLGIELGALSVAPGGLVSGLGAIDCDLVNRGVVIDSSAARLSSWSREGEVFTLRIASYPAHTYTLQTTQDLAPGRTDIETKYGADGVELVFTHDAGPSPRRFYRIAIGP